MWRIVYDYTEQSQVHLTSCGYDGEVELPFEFRLLDDDGNVYYRGFSDDNESEEAFAPLDDYGTPEAGCTDIQYRINGGWKSL
jgi:hypothetical protein